MFRFSITSENLFTVTLLCLHACVCKSSCRFVLFVSFFFTIFVLLLLLPVLLLLYGWLLFENAISFHVLLLLLLLLPSSFFFLSLSNIHCCHHVDITDCVYINKGRAIVLDIFLFSLFLSFYYAVECVNIYIFSPFK